MKVYRLSCKEYKDEIIFGLPSDDNLSIGEIKINDIVKKYKPWKHAIPYYFKKSKFAFISLDALMTFLFYNTDITYEEFNDIKDHFELTEFELVTWSSGLSKFMCTYFDDEIKENTIKKINFDTIVDIPYNIVYQDPVPNKDINFIKESYYSKIKTFY